MPELLQPSQLSHELREGTGPDLTNRRIGIGLSLLGAVLAGAVTAYQTGLVKRLPDILPGKIWDAEKVDASDYAYSMLQQPDGPMMLVNYGLTAMALAAGGKDRARQNPALSYVTVGKAAADFATCLALATQEWRENKKLCSYCQIATVISGATLALSLPEAIRAGRGGETVH
ncbi:vitamin K epoxide reductase family protein [Sphingomonas lenta]|uniref:Vitamin K epoxide reductase n=1 Tax=Sphingomonas lenta TaxID=1141887 RepID=A0A2A2SF14_9SPHN|nr:vitamin K epoxide reductase family protein [Sphingomonas lenta]PAX07856.1 vitamin K epoxide reductase [Sphingomonas lenta]